MFDHEYSKECVFSSLADIKDKRVTVMGLGLNGGGVASALFLARYGAFVTVTDMKSEAELAPSVEAILNTPDIDKSRIRFVLGKHEVSDFSDADCVIKNPGVKYDGNKFLACARAIETDISLFLRFTRAPIIAVTGSKGKSSTVSAIHYGLCKAGFTAFLGGNITVSPLTFLEQTNEHTPVVLELSSWQLADLRGRAVLKPYIAVLTTIVCDHQNWYGAMEPYVADKKLIYRDQSPDCYTLCKFNDAWGGVFAKETAARVIWYSVDGVPSGDVANIGRITGDGSAKLRLDADVSNAVKCIVPPDASCNGDASGNSDASNGTQRSAVIGNTSNARNALNASDNSAASCDETVLPCDVAVPGAHMKENLLKAAIVMRLMGVDANNTARILSHYNGIPHRLEFFHTYKGVRFYNDSAATVPESTIAALSSFCSPVLLISGGTDKKCDFAPLASALKTAAQEKHLASLYLLSGTATDLLLPLLGDKAKDVIRGNGAFDSLLSLLKSLKKEIDSGTKGGDLKIGIDTKPKKAQARATSSLPDTAPVVVFSPGATSFGMFKNEFDRGTQFKALVEELF